MLLHGVDSDHSKKLSNEPFIIIFNTTKNKADRSEQGDDDGNSSGTVAVVLVVILLLVIAAVCGAFFFLHKQGKVQLPFLAPSSNTKAGMSESEREMNGKSVPRAVNDYEKKLEERKNNAYVEED